MSEIKLKKCITGISIFGIIVSKLCQIKKLCLVILLKIDKNSKVSFYHAILLSRLTVYL